MLEFGLIFLAFYVWHGLGVTVGYHRLLSHRAFKAPKLVEYFWVLPGYLAFEGSPIWWAAIHRAHHRYVDTPLDPHSPKDGWFHSYFGWLLQTGYAEHIDPAKQVKDLTSDPIYQMLECKGHWGAAHALSYAINGAFRVVLYFAFGWKIALASLIAGYSVLQIPLLLNWACHIPKLGYQRFAVGDDSVNVWWVGILALGEGWHNNHHAFPGSAKTGMGMELDLSWNVIQVMEKLKLISNVRVPEQLLRETKAKRRRRLHALAIQRRAKRKALSLTFVLPQRETA